jgi:hypothetical protein
LLTIVSFPLSLVFGIIGTVRDKDKGLAKACALIAGAGIAHFLFAVLCRR